MRLAWRPDELDGWTLELGPIALEVDAQRDEEPPHYAWRVVGINAEQRGWGNTREECEALAIEAARTMLTEALAKLGAAP